MKNKVKISNRMSTRMYGVIVVLAVFFIPLISFFDKTTSPNTDFIGGYFGAFLIITLYCFYKYRKKDKAEDINYIEFKDKSLIVHLFNQTDEIFLYNQIKKCEFEANIEKSGQQRLDTKCTHFKMLVTTKDNKTFAKYQEIRPGLFRHSFDHIFELLEIPFSSYGIDVKININGERDVKYFKGIKKDFLNKKN